MRISPALRAAAVLICLLTPTFATGCSTTVEGVAGCRDCGVEPEFPAGGPVPPPPPQEPESGGTLEPDAAGYVYIETRSGVTRCQISADSVGCESSFTEAPTVDGEPANGVEVSADGSNRWVVGNLGAIPTVAIDYAMYQAVGWTIDAASEGTRFTNDATGHGMFVSTDRVEFF